MKKLIADLTARLAEIKAAQAAALAAARADGVSAEDRAKHVAEFDRLQAEKEAAAADLKRAEGLAAEEEAEAAEAARKKEAADRAAAAARATPERPDVTPTITQGEFSPPGPGRVTVPPGQHRYGVLKAFKGPDREANERKAYLVGLWVAARMYGHLPSLRRVEELGIERGLHATLHGGDNNKGGWAVPDVMSTAVLELQEAYGVIRRLADVVAMTSETWKGPRWTNNMVATWVGQGTAPAQSEPGWDMIELTAKDLAAYGKQQAQLAEDALIDLGDKWAMAAAVAFTHAEDNAGFNGDGTSAYGGVTGLLVKVALAANAASVVTATGNTTPEALTLADFNKVVGRFPSYPGADPRWLCHKEVYAASMLSLLMAGGGNSARDIEEGGRPRFLGYPVEFVNVMPKVAAVTTGTIGILFADLALSTKLGDRRQRRIRVGEINDDMLKQQLTLFTASRLDIVNHTIVDPKDSASAGPVVALKQG